MASEISVTFLGTGASWPTAERGLSAIALKRGGEIILFDCGEGTQRQIQRSGLSYQQVTQIYLTHYHGDHCFGVPGLLKTMALNERDRPLAVYGPRGLRRMVEAWRQMGGWPKQFEITVAELQAGDVLERDGYNIEVHRADHSVQNLAYALQEHNRPGRFDRPRAVELGVKPGPAFGRLQRGDAVTLEDGTVIEPMQVVGPSRPGRRIAYTGDTQPCGELPALVAGADLFISEATFTHDLVDRAREVKHMTAAEAAMVAKAGEARRLAITHISPRYKDATPVLEEAAAIFPDTVLAHDLLTVEVPFR